MKLETAEDELEPGRGFFAGSKDARLTPTAEVSIYPTNTRIKFTKSEIDVDEIEAPLPDPFDNAKEPAMGLFEAYVTEQIRADLQVGISTGRTDLVFKNLLSFFLEDGRYILSHGILRPREGMATTLQGYHNRSSLFQHFVNFMGLTLGLGIVIGDDL